MISAAALPFAALENRERMTSVVGRSVVMREP